LLLGYFYVVHIYWSPIYSDMVWYLAGISSWIPSFWWFLFWCLLVEDKKMVENKMTGSVCPLQSEPFQSFPQPSSHQAKCLNPQCHTSRSYDTNRSNM